MEIKVVDKLTKYLQPSYATTIHSVQGATIDKPFSIHEWDKLNESLRYVALSRSTDKSLVNIIL